MSRVYAKLPNPPTVDHLRSITPETLVLPAGTRLWRVFFAEGEHPAAWDSFRAFGPTKSRFDHHEPPRRLQTRATLYAALDAKTPFAEVFQKSRVIDRTQSGPTLCAIDTTRPLRLLDLTGAFPTRLGASQQLCSGSTLRVQPWSRVFYEAWPEIDGICYPSSMNGAGRNVALYERAQDAMPTHPSFCRRLDDPALLTAIIKVAADFGYVMR
jgi:hypothetical protein